MKIKKNVEVSVNMSLTEDEASWLMGYMQNPIPDTSKCLPSCATPVTMGNFKGYEDESTRKNREKLFESLRDELFKSL